MTTEQKWYEIKWVQILISILSFGAIIGIYALLVSATYAWSVDTIKKIQYEPRSGLRVFCNFLDFWGGQLPNAFVILVFTAMFKRRH